MPFGSGQDSSAASDRGYNLLPHFERHDRFSVRWHRKYQPLISIVMPLWNYPDQLGVSCWTEIRIGGRLASEYAILYVCSFQHIQKDPSYENINQKHSGVIF